MNDTPKAPKTPEKLQLEGANTAAFQIIYNYPQGPVSPYPKNSDEHEQWLIGWNAERLLRNI